MKCELDSVTVHYEVFGSGQPILMLHGFSCDHRLMTGCMEPIFTHRPHWKRVYMDLPGMGRTNGIDDILSSNEMLEIVDAFVEKVFQQEPFLLAGESYGGYLSRGLLKKRFKQVQGLLLICPTAGQARHDAPEFTIIAQDKNFIERLQNRDKEKFTSMHVVQDHYNWNRFEREILSGIRAADTTFLDRISLRYDLSPELEVLDTPYDRPVLIMAGRQDHVVGYRNQWNFACEYPRASFVMLDRAGHNLQIEQSRIFSVSVEEWLDRVTESQG
ncbi:alpha/beta fold hydrolase [Paenibacillus azoreducens]|uniref:2-hydroxy-6-oxo-6-phenylhexa-2,4-dienoate hydrolase n=1 Tax=Paenibacillus azoreducens TaxID=116718 RepID=A0A920CNM8_9BACL|nr:alpha/beta hydrolase [Paenibacillus azoreducens]GIO45535.1 2-hydroxy-6-oxo-6-phenylhexa-2,4-dienoate hydrolase [Paenibacillus azoreducens]